MTETTRLFRSQLGLPTDRPIVMSGHQAALWHPGILAKHSAAAALAQTTGAHAAWLVVDQDTADPVSMTFPIRTPSGLARQSWAMMNLPVRAGRIESDIPTGYQPALAVQALPASAAQAALPCVRDGLEAIRERLNAYRAEPTLARQVGLAANDLASLGTVPALPLVFTSQISGTDLFQQVVDQMRQDPAGAAAMYAQCVSEHPEAKLDTPRHGELPLWRIDEKTGWRRRSVSADQLSSVPYTSLAPKALLLTGLLRWAGCDVFIHGLGGAGADATGGYDAVTQAWLIKWLGVTLAPTVLTTATMLLPLNLHEAVTAADIDKAQWQAHSAQHHPKLLGDAAAQAARDATVRELSALRLDRSHNARIQRLALYRSLHSTIAASRASNQSELVKFQQAAAVLATRRVDALLASDRTWAFPLHAESQRRSMKSAIEAAISAS